MSNVGRREFLTGAGLAVGGLAAGPSEAEVLFPADPHAFGGGGSVNRSEIDLFDCEYHSGGKTARFRLEFKQNGQLHGQIPMAAAKGRFIAVPGSDNSLLLEELRKALEATVLPSQSVRVAELPFSAQRRAVFASSALQPEARFPAHIQRQPVGGVITHHGVEQDFAGQEYRRMRLALRHGGGGDGA